MSEHNEEEILENEGEVTFEEVNEEGSRSEERRRDPKLASEGSQNSDADFAFETVNDDGEEASQTAIKKLREKIKVLEKEKQEYLDLSQRTRADYANFKKEVEANRSSDRKFAAKRLIEEMLPTLDSYDMARGNKEAWEKVDQNWRVGIEYIFSQLRTVLENQGVVQFGKVGDTFDPMLHESMEMVTISDESKNDTIIEVLQSGYRMHDMILRPARVKVGHFEK